MVASKSIIVDLNHWDKLSEKNYDTWHRKIEYLLKKQEILETITQLVTEPEQGNIAQHRLDMEANQANKHKDCKACILMLSRMKNDIMLYFERHCSAQAVGMQWRFSMGEPSPLDFVS